MKVLTIAGTRPELIRLSVLIKKLDERAEHRLLWTAQNYTPELSTIFFEQLGIQWPLIRPPIQTYTTLADQLGGILKQAEEAITSFHPDVALVLGDTNSALSTIVCERMGVPVYHMEAGNRCFDDRVPEERNRRIIDATASHNLPYTPGSMRNLLNEGCSRSKIFVCGNPIYEVMQAYKESINKVDAYDLLKKVGAITGGHSATSYFLATFHRQENVDDRDRLAQLLNGLEMVGAHYARKVICSVHPRTKQRIESFGLEPGEHLIMSDPFGFFDFVALEQNARGVLTDSGTVQEECCILGIPTVTVRDSTERPETIAHGRNLLSGLNADRILSCMIEVLSRAQPTTFPEGYRDPCVSERVLEYIGV